LTVSLQPKAFTVGGKCSTSETESTFFFNNTATPSSLVSSDASMPVQQRIHPVNDPCTKSATRVHQLAKMIQGAFIKVPQKANYVAKLIMSHLFPNRINDREQWRKISNEAAAKAKQDHIRSLVRDWLENHQEIKVVGKSVNPVFPLGYEKYIQADEIQRRLLRTFAKSFQDTPADATAQQTLIDGTKKTIEKFTTNEGCLRVNDLFEMQALIKNYEPDEGKENFKDNMLQGLSQILQQNKRWIGKRALEQKLFGFFYNEKDLPLSIKAWLNNYPYYVRLDDIDVNSFFETLTSHCADNDKKFNLISQSITKKSIKETISVLKANYSKFMGLHVENAAIFKAGPEAFLEQQPVYIAKLLKLDHLVIDSEITSLDETTGTSRHGTDFLWHPIGNMQHFIKKGLTPRDISKMEESKPLRAQKIRDSISLQNYQEAALFGAITKQGDLHEANAFLVRNTHGQYCFKLFDIGRCLLPDGYLTRKNKTQLTLRSFLMTMQEFDKLLTAKTINLINSWDVEAFKNSFVIDEECKEKIDLLRRKIDYREEKLLFDFATREKILRSIRSKEEKISLLLNSHISSKRLTPIVRRLEQLQAFLQECQREHQKPPTMRQCYEKLFPMEMHFLKLYDKVWDVDKGAVYLAYCPVEDTIDYGVKNNRLTEEEKQYWLEQRDKIVEDPSLEKMRDWYQL